jgi:hypothetical protein
MKHILNDLTEQEKNAIREQHTGGMKVMTENFSRLLNSKLGDSKPLVAEQNKFEFDPKDLEMPELPDEETLKKFEKVVPEFKDAMQACVSEKNLYKVKGLLDNIETKKSNIFNTIMANLFDSKMGGKSLGQEFNEFSDCVRKKIGGKFDDMLPKNGNMFEQEQTYTTKGTNTGGQQYDIKSPFKVGQTFKGKRSIDGQIYTITVAQVGQGFIAGKISGPGTYNNQPLKGREAWELNTNTPGVVSGNNEMGTFTIVK